MRLLVALEKGVLLGDGANGTCLLERGYHDQPYDLANVAAPDLVREVHRSYIEAGSDFIETNTFQANRIRMAGAKYDVNEINEAGARLAREAAGPEGLVLGAIGPCGKPMEPIGHITRAEVAEAIAEQAKILADGGVDGFILETFIDMDEIEVAVEAVRSVSDLPILVSKAYIEDGEMIAEGLPSRCSRKLAELGVAAVGANCIVGPQRMLDLVRQIGESTTLPILAFPTPGLPQLVKGQVVYDTEPEYFARAVMRLVEEGATILGGCCGTTPEHIRHIRMRLNDGKTKAKPRASVTREAKSKTPVTITAPSEFAEKLGVLPDVPPHQIQPKKFVTAIEVDVPRGLNIEKLLHGAKVLKDAGADVINISDGARARLRMNPAAVSALVQMQVGIEVTMHFSCRDRNLLAIQSDLLGAHALGLRNILAVTGDPANVGDYPSATSVFDVDSIGLCRILGRFNEGLDLAGYGVGTKCAFTVACAYNPLALDQKLEDDRLRRKVDAGARVIYTQPVFSEEVSDICTRLAAEVGVPVLVGVLPLRSARHAEFMHNEVPGIRIPDDLRARIVNAADDEAALNIGVEEAQNLSRHIRKTAQGIYLMPPFGSHKIAEQVMSVL